MGCHENTEETPAPSPRAADLEAVGAEIEKLRDAAGGGVVGTAKAMAYDKCLEILATIPAAHPPKDTPAPGTAVPVLGNQRAAYLDWLERIGWHDEPTMSAAFGAGWNSRGDWVPPRAVHPPQPSTAPASHGLDATELQAGLRQALRQWRMYAEESREDRDLLRDEDAEAQIYRSLATLAMQPIAALTLSMREKHGKVWRDGKGWVKGN